MLTNLFNLQPGNGRHRLAFLLSFFFILTSVLTIAPQTGAGTFVPLPDRYWNNGTMSPKPAGGQGTISHCQFESPHLKQFPVLGMNVYLPPGYNANTNQRFPVIYLLHGVNGNENNYFNNSPSVFSSVSIVSEIEQRPVDEQAIVVWVNGGKGSFYNDFIDATGYGPSSDFPILSETVIMEDIIPFIDGNFRTIANRTGRAIEGFSMGGRGAVKLAFKNPDLFCSTVAYAGAAYEEINENIAPNHPAPGPQLQEDSIEFITNQNAAAILNNGLKILLVDGANDGAAGQGGGSTKGDYPLHIQLTDLGIPHDYIGNLPNTTHNWREYHNANVTAELDFHVACFQNSQTNNLAQQQPINTAFAILGSLNNFSFFPIMTDSPPIGTCE